MYLAPDGHELGIVEAARKFLAQNAPTARLHRGSVPDLDGALRTRFGEFGWFGVAVPETTGGSRLSAVEHALTSMRPTFTSTTGTLTRTTTPMPTSSTTSPTSSASITTAAPTTTRYGRAAGW
jgi:Acyl-CoA dehydrogenase, N-terminal domain